MSLEGDLTFVWVMFIVVLSSLSLVSSRIIVFERITWKKREVEQ